jgi:hypothetical protein
MARLSNTYIRWLAVVAIAGAAAGLIACGGGQSKSATPAAETASSLNGTYTAVQDSDGTQPKDGATVTLVLTDGKLSVHAVSADDELTDTGTYSVHDGKMTIEFVEQGIKATDGAYKLDGDTLELPVKMFSDGEGSSTWTRSSASVESGETPESGDTPDAGAANVAGVSTDLETDWDIYDLDKYATASAMKTFVEGVNDGGMSWEDAVKAAADKARTFSDVTGVTISPNGLNATIMYKDGRDEELLTERFSVSPDGVEPAATSSEPSSAHFVSAAIGGDGASGIVAPPATASSCPALPASPTGIAKVRGTNLAEPGREGLQPRGGVFGVTVYSAQSQPAPINSADSPPASARKALLFAPLYDVPHPGPLYNKQGDPIVGTWSGFRETTGDNIECISADLKRGGYGIDSILGKIDKGKPVGTGVDALVQLSKKLTSTQYGVVYFLTHGAAPDDRQIKLEMGTLGEDERKKIVGNHKMTHSDFISVEDAIRTKILTDAGLPQDDEWKHTIRANMEVNGRLEVWVSSDFFRLLREQKGVNFDQTLVFANACSSAANAGLRSAFNARAFFGWERPPDLVFASDASQTIFDELPDKARTARNAWSMWARYEKWLEAASGRARPPRTQVEVLKAYGTNGVEYARPADQTVVLIYRLRNGPASASSDITKSISVVTQCNEQFWAQGKRTGLASPACHNLELGSHLPTQEEVDDAVFEVGGTASEPFGRWTMSD